MITKKKAQAAIPLVIIGIAVLIVLYVVLLPNAEKCKILPDLEQCNRTSSSTTAGGNAVSELFLSEKPGLLEPIDESSEYSFGTVNLFNKQVTEVPLKLIGDPIIEKEWFYSKPYSIKFSTPGEAEEVIIFVDLLQTPSSGISRLGVYINGKKITSIKNKGLNTITIPGKFINRENTLTFVASTPLSIFKKNIYSIGTIIVKQTYTLTQGKITKNINIENPDSIITATLNFSSDCYSDDLLRVSVNNKLLTAEKICGEYSQDIKSLLNKSNEISFSTEGNYFLTDIRLKIKNKQSDYVTYFFPVDEESYDSIKDGKELVFISLAFGDSKTQKLVIYVNGNPLRIETDQTNFKTGTISRLLIKGQNSLRLVPETRTNIGLLEIYTE